MAKLYIKSKGWFLTISKKFNFAIGQITSLALKMERNNISRCLGGHRMEDQRERSPQTFLMSLLYFAKRKETKWVKMYWNEYPVSQQSDSSMP